MKPALVLPNSIGKRRRINTIDGGSREFFVLDEITCEQSVPEKGTRKIIYFQKLQFEDNSEIQYRFT